MRFVKGWLILTLSLGMAMIATAAPSILGPTGLLFTPTAQTLEEDGYNLSLYTIEHASNPGYSLTYGVRPNLEMGFNRLIAKETIIDAKYVLKQDAENNFGIALGVIDATDQVNASFYLVAGTNFSPGDLYGVDNFRASLGIAGGGNSRSAVPLNGLFGGMSFDIAQRITVMVEHDGSSFNYGARGNIGRGLQATAGIAGRDSNLVLQLSYNGQF